MLLEIHQKSKRNKNKHEQDEMMILKLRWHDAIAHKIAENVQKFSVYTKQKKMVEISSEIVSEN